MDVESFIRFTVLAKDKYPGRLNPTFNTQEKKIVQELLERHKFINHIHTIPKTIRVKLYLVEGSEKRTRKQFIQNALNDYEFPVYCIVCGTKKSTVTGYGCSTACGNKIKNGSFIKDEDKLKAVERFGSNPKFTKREKTVLKNLTRGMTQTNFQGLRHKVQSASRKLDQKLIAIKISTDNYRERVYIAINNYPRNSCKTCGCPVKFKNTVEYQEFCSTKCSTNNYVTRNKIKGTTMRRYGCSSTLGSSFRAKIKETINGKYNVDYISQVPAIKRKKEATLLKNHGVTNPSQSKEIQKRKEITSWERYGTKNPTQNSRILQKCIYGSYSSKPFNLNSRVVRLQGYEKQALDFLFRNGFVRKNEIYVHSDLKVPAIKYRHKGKDKVYHPDFYIESKNIIIEVKSIYTLATSKHNWNVNKAKFCAATEQGFRFFVMVMHKHKKVPMPKDWMDMSYREIKNYMTYRNVRSITGV